MIIRIKIDSKRDSIESLTILKKKLISAANEICSKESFDCAYCSNKYFCQSLLSSANFLSNYITERTNKICLK